MFRKAMLCALAGAALIPGAAIAQHGAGGGGPPAGMGGPGNAGGFGPGGPGGLGSMASPGGFGGMNGIGSTMRDQARMNSEGPANASAIGIANANQNSVLAGTTATTTVSSGPLAGLSTGTTLYSNGTAVGTVQQIRTTGRGGVAMVIVKGTNGGYYVVPANKLAFSGGSLSTTARFVGINSTTFTTSNQARVNSQGPFHASATGIAHANEHSVLFGAAGAKPTSNVGNSQRRLNSQGPTYASATGIAHANSHSVLYGANATTSTVANGRRRLNSQGPSYASATGVAHANSHSVLNGASLTSVANVSVGMPLFSNGTQIGTIYRVVSANGTIRRVLVQATNGRIYSLSPRTLTASSGSVSTSVPLRGM